MGELLYPSFNLVVPHFTEHVIPHLTSLNIHASSVLLQTFYSMLTFAFKTQIYEKRIPTLLKSGTHQKLQSSGALNSNSSIESDNLVKIIG